jgi:hypothetical protein
MEPNQLPAYRDLSGALPRPSLKPGWAGLSHRLSASLARLTAMIAVWGVLYYARWMVLSGQPAVVPGVGSDDLQEAIIGRWETDGEIGLGIEFDRDLRVFIYHKGGGIAVQGRYELRNDSKDRSDGDHGDRWGNTREVVLGELGQLAGESLNPFSSWYGVLVLEVSFSKDRLSITESPLYYWESTDGFFSGPLRRDDVAIGESPRPVKRIRLGEFLFPPLDGPALTFHYQGPPAFPPLPPYRGRLDRP